MNSETENILSECVDISLSNERSTTPPITPIDASSPGRSLSSFMGRTNTFFENSKIFSSSLKPSQNGTQSFSTLGPTENNKRITPGQLKTIDPLGACIFLFTEKMKYFIKDRPNPNYPANCMTSFGEYKLIKILSREGALDRWIIHNQKYIR